MNIEDHILMCDNNEELCEELGKIFGKKHYELSRKKNRPYDGQPWTGDGLRGKTMVDGLTMRDIKDCYVIACFQSSGLSAADYPDSIYDLPFESMDPIAIAQNMGCEIEKRMGIFPNVPELEAGGLTMQPLSIPTMLALSAVLLALGVAVRWVGR